MIVYFQSFVFFINVAFITVLKYSTYGRRKRLSNWLFVAFVVFFQSEDGVRAFCLSRGVGDVSYVHVYAIVSSVASAASAASVASAASAASAASPDSAAYTALTVPTIYTVSIS